VRTWRTVVENHVKAAAECSAGFLRANLPWGAALRYQSRDCDRIFGTNFPEQVKAMGI